jgi:hypothetical protein
VDDLKEETLLTSLIRIPQPALERLTGAGIHTVGEFARSYKQLKNRDLVIPQFGALLLYKTLKALEFYHKYGVPVVDTDEEGRQPQDPSQEEIRRQCEQLRKEWPDNRHQRYMPAAVVLESIYSFTISNRKRPGE